MTVVFENNTGGNGTVYYNVDCKKLRQIKAKYKRAGWVIKDLGEQGKTFVYHKFELS
jgi:hypothetical protein